MFLDTRRFSFTREIERHFHVFQRELDSLEESDFAIWPVAAAFLGTWRVFPFIEHCAPDDFDCDFDANCARCPETGRILRNLPRIRGAAFSRLDPNSAILLHADLPAPGILRTHLGLRIPDDTRMILGNETRHWAEGEVLCFDGQIEHATINNSPEPRDVLIIDMILTEAERTLAQIA